MYTNKRMTYRVNKVLVLYSLFTVFGFISAFWAIGFYDAAYRSLQLTLICINMFIMYNLYYRFELEYTFLYGILFASFINYMIMLGFISVPFEIIFPGGGNRAIGTMGNPNVFSIVMLISMFLSMLYVYNMEHKKNLFYYYQYINIVLSLYMIFLSVSKKGIIFSILLFSLFFLFSLKTYRGIFRIVGLLVVGIIFLIYFIDWNDILTQYGQVIARFSAFDSAISTNNSGFDSTTIRKNLILSGLDAIQNKPIFGYGLANFHYVSWNGQYAHNNYIEVLANGGIIAAIIFYSIYVYLIALIKYEKIKDFRYLLYLFLFILLLMDMAVVSYGSKFEIYFLLFLSVYLEKKRRKINNSIVD